MFEVHPKGHLAKVIWLRVGNARKANVIRLLNENRTQIRELLADAEIGCLEID